MPGQFFDLVELFQTGGDVPNTNYLFLGDYVDRGHHGLKLFLFLLALKVKFPTNITLLRGNHESRKLNKLYGLYDETMQKYNASVLVWRYCTEVFDYLSLAAVIGGDYFCVQGGLSPSMINLDDILLSDRIQEALDVGPMHV